MTKPDKLNANPGFVVETMIKRADFLRAAKAKRQHTPGFVIQARRRKPDEPIDIVRIGFTCSKKVGNAVARNRSKRRLREIARSLIPIHGKRGYDYVLIGRARETLDRKFESLEEDLVQVLSVLHPK